jgi:hypothetical protein
VQPRLIFTLRRRCQPLPRRVPFVINLIGVLRCEAIDRRYCGYEIFTFWNLFRQSVKLAEVYFWMAEHFVSVHCHSKDIWNSQCVPSLPKLTF